MFGYFIGKWMWKRGPKVALFWVKGCTRSPPEVCSNLNFSVTLKILFAVVVFASWGVLLFACFTVHGMVGLDSIWHLVVYAQKSDQVFLLWWPKQILLCRRAQNYHLKSSSVEVFCQSRAAMPNGVKVFTFSECLLNEGLQLEMELQGWN